MSAWRMSTPHLLVGGGHLSEFFTPAQWRTVRTMSLIIVLIWPPSRAATVIAGKAKSRCKSSDVLDCGLFLPRSCLPQTYPDRSWDFDTVEYIRASINLKSCIVYCIIVAFYRSADGALQSWLQYHEQIRFQRTNFWRIDFIMTYNWKSIRFWML